MTRSNGLSQFQSNSSLFVGCPILLFTTLSRGNGDFIVIHLDDGWLLLDISYESHRVAIMTGGMAYLMSKTQCRGLDFPFTHGQPALRII